MSVYARVLAASTDLVRDRAALPSLDEIARVAGVSKGGLLHHFPDRQAVVDALVRQAVAATRSALTAGAERGEAVRTWLQLSVPDGRTLAVAAAVVASGGRRLPPEVAELSSWVETLLADATGDPTLARVVRLTGDGLFADSLAGHPATPDRVEELVAFFAALAVTG